MRHLTIPVLVAFTLIAPTAQSQLKGDPSRGAEHYRACVACHSLEIGSHLSGPSLADLWGRKAGQADSFIRYSQGLRSADFVWDEHTLDAWLANPRAIIPDTYMVFRGIGNDQARADLIAFLGIAMAPDGAQAAIDRGFATREYVRGQQPEPLKPVPPNAQVTTIRHCRDSYFVTTADGVETPYWEMNVRLKLDSRQTGPEPGKPAIVGAGMVGDRVSVVFSSLQEIARFVVERC